MKELTFHRLLLRVREQHPHRVLYIDTEGSDTAAQHIDTTLRLADALRAMVKPSDRVAIVANASKRVASIFHANALGSLIAVPLNPRLSVDELALRLADCAPSLVVTDTEHHNSVVNGLRRATRAAALLILDDGEPESSEFETYEFDELLAAGDVVAPVEPEEATPALMLYTGGTTGHSRAAVATHRQLVLSLHRIEHQFGIAAEGSCLLSVNPLFHIAAINAVYAFPAYGASVVMRPRLDVDSIMCDAQTHKVTHFVAVAAILQRIVAHPGFRPAAFENVRVLAYGASPLPRDLLSRVRESFPGAAVQQNYGMTEAFGAVTCLTDADHRGPAARLASVGRTLPGVQIKILDPGGTELPSGEVGEVCVQSGSVCTQYWNSSGPEDEEWLRTGDGGYVDPDGYLFLVDRLKDMIKTGGENVYSAEVEAELALHPDIEAVAVVGLSDATWGERVHAEVVVRTGAHLTEAEVIAFARDRLTPFKVPKTVRLRGTPLPVSAVGKVLKRVLREEATTQP